MVAGKAFSGNKVGEIDTYRTRYEMNVRCLRNDGNIENYTSAEPGAEELEMEASEATGQPFEP